jgi:hypothetical protein
MGVVYYSTRAYSAYGQLLGFLRPLSVEAGAVVNGVGEGSVIVPQEILPAWWKDVQYLDVWRYSGLGVSRRWATYQVRAWADKVDGLKKTWRFAGKTLTHFLSGRPGMQSTIAASATTQDLAHHAILGGLGVWPTALPVTLAAIDGPSQRLTAKQTNQATLAALQGLVNAAKAFPLSEPFNFDVLPVIGSDGSLSLTLATWTGEYGQDRRLSSGAAPVVLWPNSMTTGYEATEDRSSITTAVELGVGWKRVTNTAALENPFGEYYATYKSSTADSYPQDVTDAQAAIQAGRPLTKLSLTLTVDVDALDLGLGDVVSVVYGGAFVDGRVNVLHASWTESGEKVSARVDIEI